MYCIRLAIEQEYKAIVYRTPSGHIALSGDMELPQLGDERWRGRGREPVWLLRAKGRSVDDVMANRQGHGFRAAGDVELGQNVADVGLDGRGADTQFGGDLAVVETGHH